MHLATSQGRPATAAGPRADETLRFERRRMPRQEVEPCGITAYFMGTDRMAQAMGLTRVTVTDRSATGIGLKSPNAVEPGMRMTFCPEGVPAGYRTGIVVRCEPFEAGPGFHLGVRYEFPKNAA
jgi:hypothetical protein